MRLALALALAAAVCDAGTSGPSASPTKALTYSATQFTLGLTPITCNLASPSWAVPYLDSGQVWGAGLHFNATTNLFTVDADTEYLVISGVADMSTCPGSSGSCYGTGTYTNTMQIVDAATTTALVSLASVSGSASYMISAPEQSVQATTLTVPSGHSFGFLFHTNFCNWVNWSKSNGLTFKVYKSYYAPSATPSHAAPSATPSHAAPSATPSHAAPSATPSHATPSAAPSRRPTLSPVSKAPTFAPVSTSPSFAPASSAPSKSPSPVDRVSTTQFTLGLTPITCNLASPSWAVPYLDSGQVWGAGLYFNATTNLFAVDADTDYIVLSGVADFGTCPGSSGSCYGSGTFTNELQVVDSSSVSVLASLAGVSGSASYMISTPEQSVQATIAIPSGHSFGFLFQTNFCNWVNWSKSNGLSLTVVKLWPSPTATPTSVKPSKTPTTSMPTSRPTTSKPTSSSPSRSPASARPSLSPSTSQPTASPGSTSWLSSTTQFTLGLTPITCNLASPNWAVAYLNAGQIWGAGLHFNSATNLFTLDSSVAYIVISGVADFGTCPGSGGVCYGSGTFTNTMQIVDAATTTALVSLASVSSTSAQYMFSAPEQSVQATTVIIPSGHTFGFLFQTNFCDWVNWSKSNGLTITVYRTTGSPTPPTVITPAPTKQPTAFAYLYSSTTFSLQGVSTACPTTPASAPAYVALVAVNGVGAGMHVNATTLTVDDDTMFISLLGSVTLNTYPATGSGNGTVSFQIVNAETGAPLATLASVAGVAAYLASAPMQPVLIADLFVPPGMALAFDFRSSFCATAGSSESDSLVVNIYKNYAAATPSPTGAAAPASANTSAIVGGVVGGLFGMVAVATAASLFMRGSASSARAPLLTSRAVEMAPVTHFEPVSAENPQHAIPVARVVDDVPV